MITRQSIGSFLSSVILVFLVSSHAFAAKASRETVVLVACVSMKLDRPAAAKELYISPWFKLARVYANRHGSKWYILSDKHGLIDPNQIVAPYDVSIKDMSIAERREWAAMVLSQLDKKRLDADRIVILAGTSYRKYLDGGLRDRFAEVVVPMKGLSIGRQLRWLKEHSGG